MKRTFPKKTLIALLSGLVAFGLFACTEKTTESTATNGAVIPGLTDPDAVFYQDSTGSVQVTYGDLYEEFKINDGINQLLLLVDTALLADEIAAVTDAELVAKEKNLKYGTEDDAIIAEIPADEIAKYEEYYHQNMVLLGYDGREADYLRLVCAKENYAIATMTDTANAAKTWAVGQKQIAEYYTASWFDDLQAIKIKFLSSTDAEAVLRWFNLVSYHGTLRLYTGTKAIELVSSASFNDTNTRVLSDAEILGYFIQMYNYVYGGYRDTIPADATAEAVAAVPETTHVYTTMKTAQVDLANYVFKTLGNYTDYLAAPTTEPLYYTYAPSRFYGADDTAYYMVLKLTDSPKVDLTGFSASTDDLADFIGAETVDAIRQILIDKNLDTTGLVAERIAELRAAHGFVIHDYYLGVDYQAVWSAYELDETGDASVVASYDDVDITADDFLAFAMAQNGPLYALYAAQYPTIFDLHFADVYCSEGENCSTNLDENDSAKLADNVETLANLKKSFEASSYAAYYTFAEYLYLAYGAKSEDDMIRKYYIKSTLQPFVIYDRIRANDWGLLTDYLYGLVEDAYDNYFSLDVQDLKIYVDRDEDGVADDYDEFLAGLADREAYDTLLGAFEDAIRAYFAADADLTFTNLVSDYNKAKRTDPTWGNFKQYGFLLSTADLSSSASLTYLNTADSYDDALIAGFVAAYAEYNLNENLTKSQLYYSELVAAGDGAYLLLCEKGTDFVKPSAKFTMTYETDGVTPKYSSGAANDADLLSLDQLKLYCELRFDQIVYGTASDVEETYGITLPDLPSSVTAAIEAYFTDLHDSMYVVGFLNIIVAEYVQDGAFAGAIGSYETDTTAIKTAIQAISTVYFDQIFADYDIVK